MAFLFLDNVFKKYGDKGKNAVNGVTFKVFKGEIVSIVGENGSGKTTLLKLIGGLLDADSGGIFFEGQKVTGPSENLVPGHPEMKMVEQGLGLFPKHTLAENILYDLRLYSKEYQEERLQELLHFFKLEGAENKLPAELSGGQQQRVALAKALAAETKLLLLDEPFSNLDVMLRDEIKRNVIRKAKEENTTLVFVTHDVKDALSLSDCIVVMKEGRVIQKGKPGEVYEKPLDAYVAYLFGNVNIISLELLFHVFPVLRDHKRFKDKKENAIVCCRPEHIMICRKENSMGEGVVLESHYIGGFRELTVEVKGGFLRIKTRRKYKEGDKIYLKIKPSKIHAF